LVSWQYPDDSADTVIEYSIELRSSDGLTFFSTKQCDGENPTIVLNRKCLVDLTTLRADPFSLTFDTYVVAIISSMNNFGWS